MADNDTSDESWSVEIPAQFTDTDVRCVGCDEVAPLGEMDQKVVKFDVAEGRGRVLIWMRFCHDDECFRDSIEDSSRIINASERDIDD